MSDSSSFSRMTANTIYNNTAGDRGGGIFNSGGSDSIGVITSTIVAGNHARTRQDLESIVVTSILDSTDNLIGDPSGHWIEDGINGNIVGVAPLLGPLADNGGPTLTHAPLPGSPAIDAGYASVSQGFDQRGEPFQRVDGEYQDIGALEVQVSSLIVTTKKDIVDGDVSSRSSLLEDQGIDGKISLREAILATNATEGFDRIRFDKANEDTPIILEIIGIDEDAGIRGDLDITDDLEILGNGLEGTIIDGRGLDRVFHVLSGVANFTGVTIQGGESDRGGGILNESEIAISHSTISGNYATVHGGGIYNAATILHISRSTLSGNSTIQSGGGLHNAAVLANVTQSTISGNAAEHGGGIYNQGAIEKIANSTISGNTANDRGGGIFNQSNAKLEVLTNNTIARNTAILGGGVYNQKSSTITRLSSSIIADNSGKDLIDLGEILSASNDLIEDPEGHSFVDGVSHHLIGVDPLLGVLENNGGITLTHSLSPDSPAINTGSNIDELDSDQRGLPRLRDNGDGPDIGSFEFQEMNTFIVTTAEDELDTTFDLSDLSLREAIFKANAIPGLDRIEFDLTLNGIPILLSLAGTFENESLTGDLDISDDLIIEGRGQEKTIIDGGNHDRVIHILSGNVNISNLRIQGGGNNQEGSGIFNSGRLRLSGGSLIDNNILVPDNGIPLHGGGLLNEKTATIANSTISNNSAGTYKGSALGTTGGGIINMPEALMTISGSNILNNSVGAGGRAGGIANHGFLEISSSIISDNRAGGWVFGGGGGGIYNFESGTLAISDTEVVNNYRSGLVNRGIITQILDSNITGNQSYRPGGGISNIGEIKSISNSIISGNSGHSGGGISNSGLIESISGSTIDNNGGRCYDSDFCSPIGGGILNSGEIENISGSSISGNSGDSGGGIDNSGIIQDIIRTRIVGNSADQDYGHGRGGGIRNSGTINNILQSTITGNDADIHGGGIQNTGSITQIFASTISGNIARTRYYTHMSGGNYEGIKGYGGGIHNLSTITNISNSIISGNTAETDGAGIFNDTEIERIVNSTITDNSVNNKGGGIFNSEYAMIGEIVSTIIAGNIAEVSAADFRNQGIVSSALYSLFEDPGGLAIRDPVKGNIVGVDPMLGPLEDNGGPTLTHALLPGSPAIDVGSNLDGLQFDQRGEPFVRVFGAGPDMGAFELQDDPTEDIIGDSNRDGRFNVFDILQVLVAGKYSTGEPATWEEGDWNKDGFFNVFDIILALTKGNFEGGPEGEAAVLAENISTQTSISSVKAIDHLYKQEGMSSLEPWELKPGNLDSIEDFAVQRRR